MAAFFWRHKGKGHCSLLQCPYQISYANKRL